MIDLHVHTKFSDGNETLEQVLERAQALKMSAISITDHDTVAAYKKLQDPNIRKLFDGKILVGIELSTVMDGMLVHIKGFEFDWEKLERLNPQRTVGMKEFAEFTKQETIRNFKRLGVKEDFNSCKCLHELGLAVIQSAPMLPFSLDLSSKTTDNKVSVLAWRYLYKPNNPLTVPIEKIFMPSQEAIDLIRSCGGKAVIAHPAQYFDSMDKVLDKLLSKVDGIEVFHWSADSKLRDKLLKLCQENNLIMTGGTDFHACGKRDLNHEQIPEEMLKQFKKFI